MPEFAKHSTLIFKGKCFDVRAKQVESRDEQAHIYEGIMHPGGVVVLPILNANEIVMIRNRRVVVDEDLWELPAGFLEKNEPAAVTAKRELLEETGYMAGKTEHMTSFYASPGMSNELIHGYVAWELELRQQQLEPAEWISVEVMTKEKICNMLRDGTIKDSKTMLLLFFYFQFGVPRNLSIDSQ